MTLFDLSGRVAVVTGGNGGIGLGYALGLAAHGCAISIWGRNENKNAEALAAVAKLGGRAEARVCDVTDPKAVDAAMEAVIQKFGRVDGCFANAGMGGGERKAFVARSDAEWDTMFDTNLKSVVYAFRAATRHMVERAGMGDRFGRLVATSSTASRFGTAQNEHYAATKAAINAITRALGVEHARFGITANAILPGWIRSEMTTGLFGSDKFVGNVLPRVPMRRFGEPEDFSGIAVYLMSNASSYHTAELFTIDGGYCAY